MARYPEEIKAKIRGLRLEGYTYSEIRVVVGEQIPKSSISYICRDVVMNPEHAERIRELIRQNSIKHRQKALVVNRNLLDERIEGLRQKNIKLAEFMQQIDAKKVALAMLYLGEGAKWPSSRAVQLGNSSPEIIKLYIDLLTQCYPIKISDLRCRVQHRADQDSRELLSYWSKVTGVPESKFYPCYVDKRTEGKKTKNVSYRGVCTIMCAGTYIQLELQQIAGIISDAVGGISSVG